MAARRGGTPLAASFVVAEAEGAEEAGESEGTVRDVAGTKAVRREYVRAPSQEPYDAPSRHVDYVLPVPGERAHPHWLTVSFSTAGDGNPESAFTRAVVDLFDAMMTTFRWGTNGTNGTNGANRTNRTNAPAPPCDLTPSRPPPVSPATGPAASAR